jgi:hypothetical protein
MVEMALKLEEYYNRLEVRSGDRILVDCGESLLVSLYIAGRAKAEGHSVTVRALVDPNSPILSESDAIEYAKTHYKDYFETIAAGAPLITFSVESIMALKTKSIFNKVVLQREELYDIIKTLMKVNEIGAGEKLVMLDLSFQFFRRLRVVRKKLFGEKKETMSFKQFLESAGCQVRFYDAVADRLICLFNFAKCSPAQAVSLVSFDEFGEMVRKELLDYIVYLKTDSQYCIESDDKQYLYLIAGEKTENQPMRCEFVFLDGKSSWNSGEPKEQAREFTIIVVPNTEAFRREIEAKNILILGKEKTFELYGEKVEPY